MRGNHPLIRILIADDHTVVREGLVAILGKIPDVSVVAEARSWSAAIPKIESYRPNVALLDVRMPGMEAADGVVTIRRIRPETKIILISAFDDQEDVYGAIRAGAHGFLVKDCTRHEIELCLRSVLDGMIWLPPGPAAKLAERMRTPSLTKRQTVILQSVAEGRTNKEVGNALNITEGTVKVHLSHIFRKLEVEGRTQAIRKAFERGIVRLQRGS